MSVIGEFYRFDPRPEADEVMTSELHRIHRGVMNVLQHIPSSATSEPVAVAQADRQYGEQVPQFSEIKRSADSHEYALADGTEKNAGETVLDKTMSLVVPEGVNTSGLEVFETHLAAAQKMVERAGPISYNGANNDQENS